MPEVVENESKITPVAPVAQIVKPQVKEEPSSDWPQGPDYDPREDPGPARVEDEDSES